MNFSDWAMIVAVLVAPFLAVFIQRQIDISREKRGQKLWIFRTLMATRANKLSLEHVQALNSIDLFFMEKNKEKEILLKWKEYLDHLNTNMSENDPNYRVTLNQWSLRGDDLLAELLLLMGENLGYDFDKVRIKKGIYSPKGHSDIDIENRLIRGGIVEILYGRRGLPICPLTCTDNDSERK